MPSEAYEPSLQKRRCETKESNIRHTAIECRNDLASAQVLGMVAVEEWEGLSPQKRATL